MAKKNSSGKSLGHGHEKPERAESERSKSSRPMTSVASYANSDTDENETYTPSGDFEKDFIELCQRNGITSVRVTSRPHRPCSPTVSPPETSLSKGGKESKEDRNRSHQSHQPTDQPKQTDEKNGDSLPLTYVTKDKFEYFQPRVEIETEDEGNKTHLKELYIKGWKVDQKITEVFSMTLPKQERLVSINLWNTGLTDETLEALALVIQQCHLLKDLCLDGNAYIRRHRYDMFLKEESSIQNLSLKNCYVNDIGAEHIGEALINNKNLLTLNLCFNKITCTGAEHLAKGLRMNRTLLSLNLGSNLISDKGCMKLAESLTQFALTHKEVVQRRMLLSKKTSEEPTSPTRGVGAVTSTQRPPSVKSGSHLKDEKKNRDGKGTSKKKDQPLKAQKDGASKKASSIDLPTKGSTKKEKKGTAAKPDKKGQAQPDHDSPELFEFPHPLMETAKEVDGELWITGNRALINLNLARNKIGITGVKEFLQTIQYQVSLSSPLNKSAGMGLLRLSLQRNSFDHSDPAYIQLNEIMLTRDPFYKPPPPQSPAPDAKDENQNHQN